MVKFFGKLGYRDDMTSECLVIKTALELNGRATGGHAPLHRVSAVSLKIFKNAVQPGQSAIQLYVAVENFRIGARSEHGARPPAEEVPAAVGRVPD